MKYYFKGICKLILDHAKGTTKSQHVATEIRLELDNQLDAKKYLDKGLPTKDGAHLLTNAFVSGLVANIHNCHERGYRDSAEHLRYVISELERGFAAVAKVSEGTME